MQDSQLNLTVELLQRFEAGDVENAIAEVQAAAPNVSLWDLAFALYRSEYDKAAENVARYLTELEPEHPRAWFMLGIKLHLQKLWPEAEKAWRKVCELQPQDSFPYNSLCAIYGNYLRNLNKLRETIRKGQADVGPGRYVSFQPGYELRRLLSPEDRNSLLTRYAAVDGTRTKPDDGHENSATETPDVVAGSEALISESGAWSEVGTTGATVAGRVAASADHAEYRFEYGPGPEALTHDTPWRPLPGALNARSQLSPQAAPTLCRIDACEAHWDAQDETCAFGSPFAMDPNHLSGLGFLSLLYSVRPISCQPDGRQSYSAFQSADFRGAEYTVDIRLKDFTSEDFLFGIGLSTSAAPWMLSGQLLDLETASPDGCATATFEMASDPQFWTFMGNNPNSDHKTADYGYAPLGPALATGTDMLFFVGVFGDWRKTPEGRIRFHDVALRYRSRSVLNPRNGTKLVSSPDGTGCDPSKLTDGRRGGSGDGWYQPGPFEERPRFQWRLDEPLKLKTLVVHQHRTYPAKQVRVSMSNSREAKGADTYSTVVTLPDMSDPLEPHPFVVRNFNTDKSFDTFQLEILNAIGQDGVGLEDVELFAQDFVPPPSHAPVIVSEDLAGLEAGTTIYYRIAVRSGDETVYGETRELTLPAEEKPILHDVALYSSTAAKSVISVRGNAMGHETVLKWKVHGETWAEIPMGWENTRVHRYISVRGHEPGAECTMTVRLVSDQGESEEKTLTWTWSD